MPSFCNRESNSVYGFTFASAAAMESGTCTWFSRILSRKARISLRGPSFSAQTQPTVAANRQTGRTRVSGPHLQTPMGESLASFLSATRQPGGKDAIRPLKRMLPEKCLRTVVGSVGLMQAPCTPAPMRSRRGPPSGYGCTHRIRVLRLARQASTFWVRREVPTERRSDRSFLQSSWIGRVNFACSTVTATISNGKGARLR